MPGPASRREAGRERSAHADDRERVLERVVIGATHPDPADRQLRSAHRPGERHAPRAIRRKFRPSIFP